MSTDKHLTEADGGDVTPAKQDSSHHRSDSALSMDSFVRIHDTSYDPDDLTTTPPGKPQPQETRNRSPAVVQPSFQSLLYAHNTGLGSDSDTVGDGSVVFTYDRNASASKESHLLPPGVTTSRPMPTTPARDRFPSYDSAGSSGSVVRNAIGASASKAQPPIGHPAHPKILPYHERRKLMQQRQQQQQQQQVSSRGPPRSTKLSQPPTPPHPPNYPPAPPNTSSPHFASLEAGNPEHGNPLLYAATEIIPATMREAAVLPPDDDQKNAQTFRQPSFEPAHRLNELRHSQQEPFHHGSNVQMHSSWEREEPRSFMPKPTSTLLPYLVAGDVIVGSNTHAPVNQWYTSSSFDSLTDLERTPMELTDPRGAIESSESEMLPEPAGTRPGIPPPPPPPNPATHVYRDSMGSFSSLGSLDRSATNRGGVAKGFLQQVNQWVSPAGKSQSTAGITDVPRGAFVDDFLSKFDQRDLMQSRDFRQISPRVPMNTFSHPPTSRGGHRRLNSIENDDWSESNDDSDALLDSSSRRNKRLGTPQSMIFEKQSRGEKIYSNESESYTGPYRFGRSSNVLQRSDERTKLLPPSGISSNEYADRYRSYRGQSYTPVDASPIISSSHGKSLPTRHDSQDPRHMKKVKRTARNTKRRSGRSNRFFLSDDSSESPSYASIPSSHRDQKHLDSEAQILQGEQWRRDKKPRRSHHRNKDKQSFSTKRSSNLSKPTRGRQIDYILKFLMWAESFIANLPLSIGAIALSIANLGVVWFKFAEVNLSSCTPVHFHSSQCSFPEFPGCFYCDTTDRMYRIAEYFHFSCSCFAGVLALSFIAKLVLAQRVVVDELSSPTTISPAGFICMTLDVVFAGRGLIGEVVVCSSAFAHLCLAVWFLYLAMAYHMLPEPSWFPATTGLGIPAIKVWLYYPMAGHFILSIALSLMFVFFPISVVRVFLNQKISATIGWMQMSAPDVALYAVTIMAQPSFQEENPDINHFQRLHRQFYLPFMSFLFCLCLLGAFASVYSLLVRWSDHSKLPFSHAHAAFCAPTLSHANAVQAYRSAVQTFSGLPATSGVLYVLYAYWLVTLIGGTFVTIYITTKYLLSLPKWTHFDIENDIEPPAPYQTAMSLASMVSSGDALVQPFVSPAILQANEAGALVFTRDSHGAVKYTRTRKVTALGFEPIMDSIEVDLEREFLLDWVTRNAPRRRNRTLSVPPGIAYVHGAPFGSGNVGVYGGMEDSSIRSSSSRRRHERAIPQRQRAFTASPQVRAKQKTETSTKTDRA